MNGHHLVPMSAMELCAMIKTEMQRSGPACDLNHIDVSNIKEMPFVFYLSPFNGDISRWDVSNVESMRGMFEQSDFNNASIEHWDTRRVSNFSNMFKYAKFGGDLSRWHLQTIAAAESMFSSTFEGVLPCQRGYMPLPRYEHFLGGPAYLEHYLKTVPFNMVHATIALDVDTKNYPQALATHREWLEEQRELMQSLGLAQRDATRLLVTLFHNSRLRQDQLDTISLEDLLR